MRWKVASTLFFRRASRMSSVTSSSSNDGVRPVVASTSATDLARSPEWSCEGDRLTPTRIACPAISQVRACRQAVSNTQAAMRSEIDDVLTTGMNSPGDTSPRTDAPSNQGFRADQIAAAEVDLWLVEQFELFALGGERKLGLKRQPGFDLSAESGLRTARSRRACWPWHGKAQGVRWTATRPHGRRWRGKPQRRSKSGRGANGYPSSPVDQNWSRSV